MKEFEIKIPVKEYQFDELTAKDRELVEAAKEATKTSYAPYSKFKVGAAVLLADGTIVTGSNQENAAYPSGTCAERTTAFYASAAHPGIAFKKLAIAARTEDGEFQQSPISPCGACRQALMEYEHLYGRIEVILYGSEKILVFPSIASLLPLTFTEF